jgi:hypothetical protein
MPGLDQGAKRAGKKCAVKSLCSVFPCLVESKLRFYIGTCAARGANSLSPGLQIITSCRLVAQPQVAMDFSSKDHQFRRNASDTLSFPR